MGRLSDGMSAIVFLRTRPFRYIRYRLKAEILGRSIPVYTLSLKSRNLLPECFAPKHFLLAEPQILG